MKSITLASIVFTLSFCLNLEAGKNLPYKGSPSAGTDTYPLEVEDTEDNNDDLMLEDSDDSDLHKVTVTAKFWYVSDFQGDAEYLADNYTREMNAALSRSNIPIDYIKWGPVEMLPKVHADIDTDGSTTNYEIRHQNFLDSFGDSEEGRQKLKQSADHMVVMLNHVTDVRGPYSCVIFGPWKPGYTEYYATLSISYNMSDTFVHEAGHCLGAMHDRYTLNNPTYPAYNYGYCLPNTPYATVMAYTDNCPPPQRESILHFSNPDVSYQGVPTGDDDNNNARAITEDRIRTSQYGSNCLVQTDTLGTLSNQCRWTEWSTWSGWSPCCCVDVGEFASCPTAPSQGDGCKNCMEYLWKQTKRTKSRNCINALNETTHANHCKTDDDEGGIKYDVKTCNCKEN